MTLDRILVALEKLPVTAFPHVAAVDAAIHLVRVCREPAVEEKDPEPPKMNAVQPTKKRKMAKVR